MSFDIHYCQAAPASGDLPDDEVRSWADRNLHFTRRPIDDGSVEYWYENEDTDVYFALTQVAHQTSTDRRDEERPPLPPPLRYVGWNGNLNYCRPSFFAYEAMPILADFAASFGLNIFDPQEFDDGRNGLMAVPHAPLLVSSWLEHNQRAIEALFAHYRNHEERRFPSVHIMDEALLTQIWRHNFHREVIQEAHGPNAFVPRVSLISGLADDVLHSVVVWGEGIPIILPRTDGILLVNTRRSFFGWKPTHKLHFVSMQDALPFLERQLHDYDRDRGLFLLKDGDRESLESTFDTILASSVAPDVTNLAKIVKFDQCIDVVPKNSGETDPGMRVIVRDPGNAGNA